MAKVKELQDQELVRIAPIDANDPLLIDIDGITFRIFEETDVPAKYLQTFLSTNKVKTTTPQQEA
jgi:hypothetical protein